MRSLLVIPEAEALAEDIGDLVDFPNRSRMAAAMASASGMTGDGGGPVS